MLKAFDVYSTKNRGLVNRESWAAGFGVFEGEDTGLGEIARFTCSGSVASGRMGVSENRGP